MIKEELREYNRRWRAANPEKAREYKRRWQKANPEKVRENIRRWNAANPEKMREKSRRQTVLRRSHTEKLKKLPTTELLKIVGFYDEEEER